MKKKLPALIAMCLMVFLITSILAACSQQPTTTSKPTTGTTGTAATTATGTTAETTMKKPESLKVWVAQLATVENYETNKFTNYYEKLTGIHINWITANHTERDTKLNLSLSSGDYPDIYATWFTPAQIVEFSEAGIFIPQNDLIDKYAPNTKKILGMDSDLKSKITAPDGKIYTSFYYFPQEIRSKGMQTWFKLWVFEPWLKQSGLGMPATLDEFKQLLIYFRDHDMNGNGNTTDEIPMLGTYQYCHDGSDPMYAIMNCFQLLPADFLIADGKKVTFAANTAAYREGLKYLNEMYKAGLVAEETYVQDLNQYRAITSVASEKEMVVGVCAGPFYSRFITQSIYTKAYEDFTAIGPLVKTNGNKKQTVFSESVIQLRCSITKACKYPEAAMQWIDAAFDKTVAVTCKYGYEGEHWTRTNNAITDDKGLQFMLTDTPLIPKGSSTQNSVWQDWTLPYYNSSKYVVFTQAFKEGTINYIENKKQTEANNLYLDCAIFPGIPSIVWNTDANLVTEKTEMSTLINNYVKQSYSQFILGKLDINSDAAWNAYLSELEKMDLSKYLDLCTKVYFG